MNKTTLLELLTRVPDDEEIVILIDPDCLSDEIAPGDIHEIEDAGGVLAGVGYVIRTRTR